MSTLVASSQAQHRRPLKRSDWAFSGLLLLGALIVFGETSGLGFSADDWDFVVLRRGLGLHTLLDPHGPHLSLFPILAYKVLLQVFGGGSYLPFRFLSMFDLTLLGLALGHACRRFWGPWWGLCPVLLLMTLGAAGVSTLWSFQVGFALAVAFGVFALLALRERRTWSDPACCLCLVISLGSASQGVGFVIGAAFMLVLTGDWKRRVWAILVPATLYVIWYGTIGHSYGETRLSLWPTALGYEMQTLGVTIAALCGLSSVLSTTGTLDPTFAAPIALFVVTVIAGLGWRGWRPPPLFWGTAATAVVIWFAAALSDFAPYGRPPTEPRYLASDAILILICLCAAVPHPRLPRGGVFIACIVLAIVALTNSDQYGQQRGVFLAGARLQRAELGALELMRGTVAPSYNPGVVDPNLVDNSAAPFFDAVESFGLREDAPAQIRSQPESTRVSVDRILASNELLLTPSSTVGRLGARPMTVLSGSPRRSRGCLVVGTSALDLNLAPGSVVITAKGYSSTITAARFATVIGYPVGTLSAHATARLTIRPDRAPQIPWRLSLTGTGARVCSTG